MAMSLSKVSLSQGKTVARFLIELVVTRKTVKRLF